MLFLPLCSSRDRFSAAGGRINCLNYLVNYQKGKEKKGRAKEEKGRKKWVT